MAWNKPSTENQQSIKKNTAKAPSAKRGVIAGAVIIVALGALCLYLFTNGEADSRPLQKKERGLIKEVTPAAAPTNKAVQTESTLPPYGFWAVDASKTNGFTPAMIRKWTLYNRPRRKAKPRVPRMEKYEIFSHPSENQIAGLIMHEPGVTLIGRPVFNQAFEKDFMKSCEEPIIVGADDDDYTRNLKQTMIDTKIELRQRMSEGESLNKILYDAHEELQRLGQVKRAIETEMRTLIKEGAQTENDIDDFVDAANKMLEEKGIAPMKKNAVVRRALARLINSKGAKE